jgi:hypothetical protein
LAAGFFAADDESPEPELFESPEPELFESPDPELEPEPSELFDDEESLLELDSELELLPFDSRSFESLAADRFDEESRLSVL